jgi:biotin transport system substrate-specific component
MAEVRPVPLSHYIALRSDHVIAQAFWIVLFAACTAIGAQVEIPHYPVPYTFQTFFVLLAGGLLGRRNGFLSMLTYLGMGAIGLPVFSASGAGLARLLGPTGGYLLSFPIAAYMIGYLIALRPQVALQIDGNAKRLVAAYGWTAGAMSLGLLLIFLLGTLQLNAVYFHDWALSFQSGFLIFSWWDILKLAAAVAVCKELSRS